MAEKSYGTTITGSSCGDLGKIVNITDIGLDHEDIDISTLDSDEDVAQFMEGTGTGEISLDCVFDKTEFATLLTNKGVSDSFTITTAGGTTFAFDGYIKNPKASIQRGEKITGSFGIKITSTITFTPAA